MSIQREDRELEGDLYVKSPITNEFTAVVESDDRWGESALCTESGYCWSPSYTEESMPEPVKKQAVKDEQGQYWYPVTIRTKSWIIFRDGTKWTYADIIPLENSTPCFDSSIDMENKKVFETFALVSDFANNKLEK